MEAGVRAVSSPRSTAARRSRWRLSAPCVLPGGVGRSRAHDAAGSRVAVSRCWAPTRNDESRHWRRRSAWWRGRRMKPERVRAVAASWTCWVRSSPRLARSPTSRGMHAQRQIGITRAESVGGAAAVHRDRLVGEVQSTQSGSAPPVRSCREQRRPAADLEHATSASWPSGTTSCPASRPPEGSSIDDMADGPEWLAVRASTRVVVARELAPQGTRKRGSRGFRHRVGPVRSGEAQVDVRQDGLDKIVAPRPKPWPTSSSKSSRSASAHARLPDADRSLLRTAASHDVSRADDP